MYFPPSFFWWWFSYDAYARAIFQEGAIIAASGGFLSVGVAIFMSLLRAREADNIHTYGSARWATPEELGGADLLNPNGVILGRYERDYGLKAFLIAQSLNQIEKAYVLARTMSRSMQRIARQADLDPGDGLL